MLIEPTVHLDVFHTPTGIAFADLITDGRETRSVRSVREVVSRTAIRPCKRVAEQYEEGLS
jgi:hypothetical protein